MKYKDLIPYQVRSAGNENIACQVRPLNGPLNEFGNRTSTYLKSGDVVYKASDVHLVILGLMVEISKLKKVQEDISGLLIKNSHD